MGGAGGPQRWQDSPAAALLLLAVCCTVGWLVTLHRHFSTFTDGWPSLPLLETAARKTTLHHYCDRYRSEHFPDPSNPANILPPFCRWAIRAELGQQLRGYLVVPIKGERENGLSNCSSKSLMV